MGKKLTEVVVHNACNEIMGQGEKPTALTLLDKLGRGSLTTITKYLMTWTKENEEQAAEAETRPAVIELPDNLVKNGEELLKTMWNTARDLAGVEVEIQREALKQAELVNQKKVEDAYEFSEAQSKAIDRLEEELELARADIANEKDAHSKADKALNEAEKINVGLIKDLDQANEKNSGLNKLVADLEAKNKAVEQDLVTLKEQQAKEIVGKDKEINSLDMQVHKLQSSLDSAVKTNDGLRADIKEMAVELKNSQAEAVKLSALYEGAGKQIKAIESDIKAVKSDAEAEIVEVKKELKTAQNDAVISGKEVAKLQGKLEVYALKDKESVNK